LLTAFRRQKMSHMFDVYDRDRDGYLEEDDYHRVIDNFAAVRSLKPAEPGYQAIHDAYMRVWHHLRGHADTNRDDRVNLEEMLAYNERLISSEEAFHSDVLEIGGVLFNVLDLDRDGVVGEAEYRTFCLCLGIDESRSHEAFAKLDTNGDGRVNMEDTVRLVREFYLSDEPDSPGNWFFGPLGTPVGGRA